MNMQKFPFTNEGFQELQNALYALPDAALEIEATAIQSDFNNWMNKHFELAPSQVNFLQHLDERAVSFLAFQTSFAVGNCLPIFLHKADPPADDDEIDKIVWPKSTLSAKAGTNFGFEASGVLEIHIDYQ
jgi:hypothetical protein